MFKAFCSEKIENVIWFQTAFIGDLVLSSASFCLLAAKRKNIKQHLITTAAGAEIYKSQAEISSVYVLRKKNIKFLSDLFEVKKILRKKGLNKKNTLILQTHKSYHSSLSSFYLSFPTATFEESSLSFLADWRTPKVAVFHEASRQSLLLASLNISREEILSARPKLKSLSFTGEKTWHKLFLQEDKKFIALVPGSVWATKKWPLSSYKDLALKLLCETEHQLIFLGSETERKETLWLEKEVLKEEPKFKERIINLGGKTDLSELLMIFPRLLLLIANDSSAIHFASAFDLTTVAIFGPTSSKMGFSPKASRKKSIENNKLNCRPCHVHGPKTCPLSHFACMNSLSSQKVFLACKELLS